MRRILTLSSLLVLCFILLVAYPTLAKADLEVLSWAWYETDLGYHRAVGELKNKGDMSASFIKCVVTWYSEGEEVVGTAYSYTLLETVRPGEIAPFQVTLMKENISPAKAKLQFDWNNTNELPARKVEVMSSRGFLDRSIGYFKVIGEVKNKGNSTARYVKIIATFYNKEGKVVNTGFTYASLEKISPGSTSPFTISVSEMSRSIEKYRLVVEYR